MADDAGYSGTPLAKQLGIRDGSALLVDGRPAGFELGTPTSAPPYGAALMFTLTARRWSNSGRLSINNEARRSAVDGLAEAEQRRRDGPGQGVRPGQRA